MSQTSESTDLNPVEQLAFPFIKSAIQIDAAKQDPSNREALVSVLENNVALWMFMKNYLTENFRDVPEDTRKFLVQMSEFMVKAALFLQENPNENLMDRLVTINLNMSERILENQKP